MSNEKNELKQAKEVCEMLGINNDRLKYFKKRGVFVSETSRAGYTAKDIDRLKQLVVKRYMREDTYGKLDVQHYKPLFDLYEQTIKEEKERAELLVRAFSLSNQCRHLQYDDIKNIIIDSFKSRVNDLCILF